MTGISFDNDRITPSNTRLSFDKERLMTEVSRRSRWTPSMGGLSDVAVITLQNLIEALSSLICKAGGCYNECRYDSGYCSLCDMEFNDSRGKRITHPEPE